MIIIGGQYSLLRGDDDDIPPPVPAYNPDGVQEYSVLKREGEVIETPTNTTCTYN